MSCIHGYAGGSNDGLRGQILGTEVAEVQTGIRYSIETVLPSDMHHGIQRTKFSFFFFARPFGFPGVGKHLMFLFTMFSIY